MDNAKVAEYIEILCQNGCQSVNAAIEAMENNQPPASLGTMTDEERYFILKELKSIMAVYKN